MKPATIDSVRRAILRTAQDDAKKIVEGLRKSIELSPDAVALAQVLYGFFVMLPDWLAPSSAEGGVFRRRHGAFLYYRIQAENDMAAAFRLATTGHYSASLIILRSCMEYLCWGAFYDLIAREEYRKDCRLLNRHSKPDALGERGSIRKLLQDLEKHQPGFLDELETDSGAILDKLSVFMGTWQWRGMFPTFKEIITQLDDWNVFTPIPDPVVTVYRGGYHFLSYPVHGHIDHIDTGRRVLLGSDLFGSNKVEQEGLSGFLGNYCQLLDAGFVLTWNLIAPSTPPDKREEVKQRFTRHALWNHIPAKWSRSLMAPGLKLGKGYNTDAIW